MIGLEGHKRFRLGVFWSARGFWGVQCFRSPFKMPSRGSVKGSLTDPRFRARTASGPASWLRPVDVGLQVWRFTALNLGI